MTDERMGEALLDAVERLPRGAGIVFRHHSLGERERIALYRKIRRIALRRRLTLVVAGPIALARRLGADGAHLRAAHVTPRGMIRTVSVHNARELVTARRARADLAFVSPVFATRSHPGAHALGRVRFGLLTARSPIPVVALGGLDARRARSLARFRIHGWAAIDAWTKAGKRRNADCQKRNAVPT